MSEQTPGACRVIVCDKEAIDRELLAGGLDARLIDDFVAPLGTMLVMRVSRVTPDTPGRVLERGIYQLGKLSTEVRLNRPDVKIEASEPEIQRLGEQANETLAMLGVERRDGEWCRLQTLHLYDVIPGNILRICKQTNRMLTPREGVLVAWGVYVWALRVTEQVNVAELQQPEPPAGAEH